MNLTVIKQRLRSAKRLWENNQKSQDVLGLPGFIPGVVQGFREALTIIRQYQREELKKTRGQRRPLSRWNGIILYKACAQAYQRLKHSDRGSAMRILQQALVRIGNPQRDTGIHPAKVIESGDPH